MRLSFTGSILLVVFIAVVRPALSDDRDHLFANGNEFYLELSLRF